MNIKKWKEIQPLPCEVCGCCENAQYYFTNDKLVCKKYRQAVPSGCVWKINDQSYEELFIVCKCKKSYPSISKKLEFIRKKIQYYKECLDNYVEDVRYHRFDD